MLRGGRQGGMEGVISVSLLTVAAGGGGYVIIWDVVWVRWMIME